MATRIAISRGLAVVGWLAAIVPASGCGGYLGSRFEWTLPAHDVGIRTKLDVVAKFGEPVRKADEDGKETWYYLVTKDVLPGFRPVTQRASFGFIVVIPFGWTTRAHEDVKVMFDGDRVATVALLTEERTGAICGPFMAHGGPGCLR